MKAVVIHEHGGPDKAAYVEDYPDPLPGEGEVIVRVQASSLNFHDVFTRRGMPGIKLRLPLVPGLDAAGEIAKIGPGVVGWRVGDRVLVDPVDRIKWNVMGEMVDGGLAELCRVAAHQLMRLPPDVSFEHAAAIPVAYGTAYRMLRRGRVKEGERVLVLGASGGVGTACLLLAKKLGAEVIAVTSREDKLARLAALGADHCLNASVDDFVAATHARFGKPQRRSYEGGVDCVVNFCGGDTWVRALRCLKRSGRVLTCGATAGFDPKTDLRYIWSYELEIMGSNGWTPEDLAALVEMVRAGSLTPVIDRVVSLRDTAEALRLLEQREVVGKVVVSPSAASSMSAVDRPPPGLREAIHVGRAR